jgi:general stress protein 26
MRRRLTMKVEQQQSEGLTKIGELLKRMKVGMFVTVDDGVLRSRRMQTLAMDARSLVVLYVRHFVKDK